MWRRKKESVHRLSRRVSKLTIRPIAKAEIRGSFSTPLTLWKANGAIMAAASGNKLPVATTGDQNDPTQASAGSMISKLLFSR